MLSDEELEALLRDVESDRCERTRSTTDRDKFREAICAFANDMPGHRQPGILFVGAMEDGSCAGSDITDELLRTLADMRSDGNILPIPSLDVQKKRLAGGDMAVVVVHPAAAPPVRYKGRIWIRVGPRRAIASADEERRLNERRQAGDLPFELRTVPGASLNDIDRLRFLQEYLPAAVAPDVLQANHRSFEEQLASLRFASPPPGSAPTVLGLLAVGKSPADFIAGASIQFLRINGTALADPITNGPPLITGPVNDLIRQIEELIRANLNTAVDLTSEATERRRSDYPRVALEQFIRNAILHRDYETSNAPIRVTWFNDRIEIHSPGGPYGQVSCENFGQPGLTDYRNRHLAGVLRDLGYVQRFGVGIATAQKALRDNGNPDAEFTVNSGHVLVTLRRAS